MNHESMFNCCLTFESLCGCMYLSLEFYDGLLLSDTKWMMHEKGKQSHNVYILNGFDSFHTACSQFFLSLSLCLSFSLFSDCQVYFHFPCVLELLLSLHPLCILILSLGYFIYLFFMSVFLIPPKKEVPCSSVSCYADWWAFITSWMVVFVILGT